MNENHTRKRCRRKARNDSSSLRGECLWAVACKDHARSSAGGKGTRKCCVLNGWRCWEQGLRHGRCRRRQTHIAWIDSGAAAAGHGPAAQPLPITAAAMNHMAASKAVPGKTRSHTTRPTGSHSRPQGLRRLAPVTRQVQPATWSHHCMSVSES